MDVITPRLVSPSTLALLFGISWTVASP